MQASHFWVNGHLVPVADAHISVLDHGFMVADGVFETLKISDGRAFAVDRHNLRLRRSASGLGIKCPSDEVINSAIAEILAANPAFELGRLRVTVTSGIGPLGSDRIGGEPTLVLSVAPQPAWPSSTGAVLVPWMRNELSAIVGLKTISYAENVYALEAAHKHGFSEALFLDSKGNLSEGTGSNVFLVSGDTVLTPSVNTGLLLGITRQLVIEWGLAAGIKIIERDDLRAEDLWNCDGAFLTSSTRDVQPISALAELSRADSLSNAREVPIPEVVTELAKLFKEQSNFNYNP
ncbi:MAG: 4-amino-4-deoxychorismate lyase [Actinobacteria bacterium]|nr:4-amino-4-deoxychorismate lyase [Actinomycetota bacterium]NBY15534.1 4-amino-4-deoxychorismate lyase [Actinomycetota bacterium]